MPDKLEQIFDAIAEALIQSSYVNPAIVEGNQKTIKNGIISLGRTNADKLILFEKDIKANSRDLLGIVDDVESILGGTLETISNNISVDWIIEIDEGSTNDIPIIILIDDPDGTPIEYNLTPILYDGEQNPINVSQFLNINKQSQNIDSPLADEFLDTSIFELLGDTTTRQDRINNFFLEFQNLTNNPPTFNVADGLVDDAFSSDDYSATNDISYANDEPTVESSDKFITRLDRDNDDTENPNSNTLQSLRDRLNTYLVDIDQEFPSPEDQRPTYKNKSDGYLKFRNLNQGIIIRNTNKEFVEGLDPSNLTYLNEDGTGGFTITTWVRFLDKTSEGTLFNFGNPLRPDNPFGFKLETYVLNKDDLNPHGTHATWGIGADYIALFAANDSTNNYIPPFENSNTARFVRLVVNDDGTLRDSHTGNRGGEKLSSGVIPIIGGDTSNEQRLLHTTFIPENFSEWYFICATFNPTIDEDGSYSNAFYDEVTGTVSHNTNFWMNNFIPSGPYTPTDGPQGVYITNSGYGNRCKVEIISRTDLLRARGLKG